MTKKTDRRGFLNKTLLGAMGAGTALSLEEQLLLAAADEKTAAAAPKKPDIAAGSMPNGKIGKVSVSRLFIGGNLIGGWAHSRDLMYASKLFTSYNTEAKVFETLEIAQACGINTIQIDPKAWGRELRRPTWIVVAFRNRPKATKNDSPNPIIEAEKAPSKIEYLRLFRTW